MLEVSQDEREAIVALARTGQEVRGWTDAEVGERLGYSESAWRLVRQGQRKPGLPMLKGIRRVFPETGDLVNAYFLRG